MCFGSGSAAQASIGQEKQQQQQIQQGLQSLNSIFQGGTYGVNPSKAYTPGTSYYNSGGSPINFSATDPGFLAWLKQNPQGPTMRPSTPGGSVPISPGALSAYGNALAKSGQLYGGTQTSQGFTPQFYQQQQQNYANYELPLLQGQYNQTLGQTLGSLNTSGLLGSSSAQQLYQSLQNQYAQNQQQVANQGQSLAQGLQQQVGQEQSTLTNQLLAGSSPSSVTQSALASASNFGAPSLAAPIGNLFQNWTNQYLGGQLASAYNQQGMNPLLYNYNLLKTNSPSSSVVSQG